MWWSGQEIQEIRRGRGGRVLTKTCARLGVRLALICGDIFAYSGTSWYILVMEGEEAVVDHARTRGNDDERGKEGGSRQQVLPWPMGG